MVYEKEVKPNNNKGQHLHIISLVYCRWPVASPVRTSFRFKSNRAYSCSRNSGLDPPPLMRPQAYP